MNDEWGPWIEHDGKGCPCVGEYVNVVCEYDEHHFGIAGSEGGRSWDWSNSEKFRRYLRYRIRTPRGLTILRDILREVEHNKQPEYTAH